MDKDSFKKIRDRIITRICYWISMHSPIAKAFWHLFKCFPINQNLILFESEPDFCDNSWALYQYLKSNRPCYRFVWIVQDVKAFKDKVDKQTSFATRYGRGMHLKTIFYYATAKFNFYTHWTYQPYIPRKEQTVINLWHGGFPLKSSKVKNIDYFDWIISLGEEGKDCLTKYIGCSKEKVLALGNPRIDLLVKSIGKGVDNPFVFNKHVNKVIIWMPTFRASVNHSLSENLCDTQTGLPLLTTQEDIIRFNGVMQDMNVVVIAKIHHLQAQKELFHTKYSNFIFLTDDTLSEKDYQLYEIIGKSDALLTDYSTVVWDYLTVDKPVGFILDDIDKYKASCGFLVDNILDILKGEHIFNKQHLIQFIKNVIDEKDNYQVERHELLNKKIQMFPQGGNCKNIVDHFKL